MISLTWQQAQARGWSEARGWREQEENDQPHLAAGSGQRMIRGKRIREQEENDQPHLAAGSGQRMGRGKRMKGTRTRAISLHLRKRQLQLLLFSLQLSGSSFASFDMTDCCWGVA
jgi:hypothetical protein